MGDMKRFLAILLSVLMLWSVLPINGIAEELTETLQVTTEPAVIGISMMLNGAERLIMALVNRNDQSKANKSLTGQ